MQRLQADDLTRRLWRLRNAEGAFINPVLTFLRNGDISNHDVFPERRWSLDDGHLQFKDDKGTVHVRFGDVQEQDGRLVMWSPARNGSHGPEPVMLESRLLYRPPPHPAHAALYAEMSLSRPSRPLLVVFNSGSRVFESRRPDFDYYQLPADLDVDYLRFAEHEAAFACFVDKTQLIERHLEHWLGFGYSRVVFVGLSAAGYIAVAMAERMAGRHPELSFASVVANAQLSLDPAVNDALAETARGYMLPPVWNDRSVEVADFPYVDIAEMLRRSDPTRENVRHVVLYDSGNAGEVFFSAALEGLPCVDLQPVAIGFPHAAGIRRLGERGLIIGAIQQMTMG